MINSYLTSFDSATRPVNDLGISRYSIFKINENISCVCVFSTRDSANIVMVFLCLLWLPLFTSMAALFGCTGSGGTVRKRDSRTVRVQGKARCVFEARNNNKKNLTIHVAYEKQRSIFSGFLSKAWFSKVNHRKGCLGKSSVTEGKFATKAQL